MYEQGQGKLNLINSMNILKSYQPKASIVPKSLDFTDCPYMWPFCTQPIYAHALPLIFNATVLNAMALTGNACCSSALKHMSHSFQMFATDSAIGSVLDAAVVSCIAMTEVSTTTCTLSCRLACVITVSVRSCHTVCGYSPAGTWLCMLCAS